MLLWSRVIINKIQMIFTGIATRKENKDQEEEIVTKRQVRRGIGKFFRPAPDSVLSKEIFGKMRIQKAQPL